MNELPAFEREPYLTELETSVLRVGEDGGRPYAVLADSILYPEGGGQPPDHGFLGAVAVIDVQKAGGEVRHYLAGPAAPGPARLRLQWPRRFDHMQQHTGQHLLSAVFLRELNAPTVSFHLGECVSTIDLAGGSIAHHSLERVERIANEIIAEDRGVSARTITRADAEAMLAAGELRKLPERPGEIRLIEIDALDRNACGGTHVRSTGQIGGLLLRGTEKVSRGVRVEFVCGLRAVRAARADAAIISQATAALSVGPPGIPAAVERLKAESKASLKDRQRLREELADYHAARLAVEVPINRGLRFLDRSWKDRDPDYVRLLASRVTTAAPSTILLFSTENSDPASVVLACSLDINFDCGAILKEALSQIGLRGGGSADFAQGEVPILELAKLRTSLGALVRSAAVHAR